MDYELIFGILLNLAVVAVICGAVGVGVHLTVLLFARLVKRMTVRLLGRAVKLPT